MCLTNRHVGHNMHLSDSASIEALQQLPASLQALMRFEREYIHKPNYFFNTALDRSFDKMYFPQNSPVFELPCYWVQRKHLYVNGCHESCMTDLRWPVGKEFRDEVLFPIHPLTLSHYHAFLVATSARSAAVDGVRVLAIPTSSVRTVLAWRDRAPDTAVFLKLSVPPSPIYGDRRIWASKGAACIGLTRLLEDSRASRSSDLSYLAEVLSLSPRTMPDGGVIVRRLPREVKEGRVLMSPLYALFGGATEHRPLLLTLAEHGGVTPKDFVENTLCADFARIWLKSTLTLGLLPECHGQNLLLSLSPSLHPLGSFYYRDFDGLFVDWGLRHIRKFAQPSNMPYDWRWFDTYERPYATLPCTAQLWWKLQVSCHAYLHFVLNELNQCMQEWKLSGLMAGPVPPPGYLTMRFSEHVFEGMEKLFGRPLGCRYNVYECQKRFYLHFLRLRNELMRGHAGILPSLVSESSVSRTGLPIRTAQDGVYSDSAGTTEAMGSPDSPLTW